MTKPNSQEGNTMMTQEEYVDIPGFIRKGWTLQQIAEEVGYHPGRCGSGSAGADRPRSGRSIRSTF